jgi:hypothetical protein
MPLHSSWLSRGNFFDLSAETPPVMQAVRDELSRRLRPCVKKLRIAHFPPGGTLKHCYWWREGDAAYTEAQFFAEISRSHPVLSLGISIEKGREDEVSSERRRQSKPRLDRRTWDWERLMNRLPKVLRVDVPAVAGTPPAPVHLRIRSKRRSRGASKAWEARTFSFTEDVWFQRHYGQTDVDTICQYIRGLDEQEDTWVVVQFARDLFPADVEGMSASDAATMLIAFDGVRRRIRARLTNAR